MAKKKTKKDEDPNMPDEDTILVVNMFSGSYLKEGIAHEIVNVFRTDKDEHYLYVPRKGNMAFDEIKKVLMVRHVGLGIYQVIGRATDVENLSKDEKKQDEALESMVYGGQAIQSIMQAAGPAFFACGERVTFRAKPCERPKDPIFITCIPEEEARALYGYVPGAEFKEIEVFDNKGNSTKLFGESQRRYLNKPDRYEDKIERSARYQPKAYYKLCDLFESSEYSWEKFPKYKDSPWAKLNTADEEKPAVRFLSLIGKEDSELAYSNMLAYFLRADRGLCRLFIEKLSKKSTDKGISPNHCNSVSDTTLIEVAREKMHVDLLIETKDDVFILENKINAALDENDSKLCKDEPDRYEAAEDHLGENQKLAAGQLQRYVDAALKESKCKNLHVFIMCPSRHGLYKEYESYMASNGKKGKQRKVILDKSGNTICTVHVLSYKDIQEYLGCATVESKENTKRELEVTKREKEYFDDFIAMLEWQEHDYGDQNERFLNLSRKRFARAVQNAKSKNEAAE